MATYSPRPLTVNEASLNAGMTHTFTIDADDLTETTANTPQTITICSLKAGDIIGKISWRAKTFLQDASDSAFNSTTMSVGDDSAVTTHIAAIQVNINGTEVRQGFSNTAVHYAAANHLTVTFNSMALKSLSNIDVGEIEFFFQLYRPSVLEQSVGSAPVTTK